MNQKRRIFLERLAPMTVMVTVNVIMVNANVTKVLVDLTAQWVRVMILISSAKVKNCNDFIIVSLIYLKTKKREKCNVYIRLIL